LFLALKTPRILAGVLALSTWLPLSKTFPKVRFTHNNMTKISIGEIFLGNDCW